MSIVIKASYGGSVLSLKEKQYNLCFPTFKCSASTNTPL